LLTREVSFDELTIGTPKIVDAVSEIFADIYLAVGIGNFVDDFRRSAGEEKRCQEQFLREMGDASTKLGAVFSRLSPGGGFGAAALAPFQPLGDILVGRNF
jgi:hypothetical protein